jgi:L-ascorbate metabolism protein UlaG (beta-lactamase superfamily)
MKIVLFLLVLAAMLLSLSCSRNFTVVVPDIEPKRMQSSGYIKPYFDSATATWNYPIAALPRDSIWGAPYAQSDSAEPAGFLPYHPVDMAAALPPDTSHIVLTWNGHSTTLLQVDGVRILLDPLFVDNLSPVPLVKMRRFQKESPLNADIIPRVDIVALSHDHYDHMDRQALLDLAPKTSLFLAPLGVGKRLVDWGIDAGKVREYSWWGADSMRTLNGQEIHFAVTPTRHNSGRSVSDRNTTLFGSWVFWTDRHRIFYSGDGSYGPHFAQVGAHYGPFDLAIVECGQYNPRWARSHMFPEETVQTALDVKAAVLLPVHWGAFSLSPHDWQDPPRRVKAAYEKLPAGRDLHLLMPEVGETVEF